MKLWYLISCKLLAYFTGIFLIYLVPWLQVVMCLIVGAVDLLCLCVVLSLVESVCLISRSSIQPNDCIISYRAFDLPALDDSESACTRTFFNDDQEQAVQVLFS